MVEGVGVDRIDRGVRKYNAVEVAGQHELVLGARIEVDTHREMPQLVERLDLGPQAGAETQDGPGLLKGRTVLEALDELAEILVLILLQPVNDLVQLGRLVGAVSDQIGLSRAEVTHSLRRCAIPSAISTLRPR